MVLNILTLIGAIVLFLFGMKLMSEALQKVAGNNLRKILAAMTSNRFLGVLTGVLITAIIQSSSATTVMVVSFVNAGLLSLSESIGVIMGANVGTTITAWIISLVGFKIDINILALPLIGISFPLIFSKKSTKKSWGEVIMGFAILFIGLGYLKESGEVFSKDLEILNFVKSFSGTSYANVLLFLFIGTILTIVIQSSSATMALTLVMCYNGWISYEMAIAMILGENIGTTVTANIAAIMANTSAKRAALSHLIFNIFGVMWVTILFFPIVKLIAGIVEKMDGSSPFDNPHSIPVALSLFHTSFNITNVLIQVWFIKYIEKVVTIFIKSKKDEDEEFGLVFLHTGMLSTSELSILQARKENAEYAKKSQKMFIQVKKQFVETDPKKRKKIAEKVSRNEIAMDELEVEIANYLTQVSEGELSIDGARKVRTLLKISDNVESLADCFTNLSYVLLKKAQKKIWFTPEQRNDIQEMFKLIDKGYELTLAALNDITSDTLNLYDINEIEEKINNLRDKLKKQNTINVDENKYSYQSSVIYMDIITLCETVGDHLININEALSYQNSDLVSGMKS